MSKCIYCLNGDLSNNENAKTVIKSTNHSLYSVHTKKGQAVEPYPVNLLSA